MNRIHAASGALPVSFLLIGMLAACSDSRAAHADPPTTAPAFVADNCGTQVALDAPPKRIVTVKSSTLELLLALGAGGRVVGSAFSDGPLPEDLAAAADGIPVLSDKLPSQESVLALEPDLIYAGWESNFSLEGVGDRDDLERMGISTYVASAACKAPEYMPRPLTFDLVFNEFEEVGRLVGETKAAAALVAEQREKLKQIVPDERGLTAVWYSSGKDQPFVGAGIGAPQMIMGAAGLENVFAEVQDSWTSTSWELVADANPDVLVLVDSAWNTAESKIELLKSNPITADIDAVKHERFLIVDFPATEAGIRTVEAVSTLVEHLGARG